MIVLNKAPLSEVLDHCISYSNCICDDSNSGERFKTRLCKHWSRGSCRIGNNCKFAHGISELRAIMNDDGLDPSWLMAFSRLEPSSHYALTSQPPCFEQRDYEPLNTLIQIDVDKNMLPAESTSVKHSHMLPVKKQIPSYENDFLFIQNPYPIPKNACSVNQKVFSSGEEDESTQMKGKVVVIHKYSDSLTSSPKHQILPLTLDDLDLLPPPLPASVDHSSLGLPTPFPTSFNYENSKSLSSGSIQHMPSSSAPSSPSSIVNNNANKMKSQQQAIKKIRQNSSNSSSIANLGFIPNPNSSLMPKITSTESNLSSFAPQHITPSEECESIVAGTKNKKLITTWPHNHTAASNYGVDGPNSPNIFYCNPHHDAEKNENIKSTLSNDLHRHHHHSSNEGQPRGHSGFRNVSFSLNHQVDCNLRTNNNTSHHNISQIPSANLNHSNLSQSFVAQPNVTTLFGFMNDNCYNGNTYHNNFNLIPHSKFDTSQGSHSGASYQNSFNIHSANTYQENIGQMHCSYNSHVNLSKFESELPPQRHHIMVQNIHSPQNAYTSNKCFSQSDISSTSFKNQSPPQYY